MKKLNLKPSFAYGLLAGLGVMLAIAATTGPGQTAPSDVVSRLLRLENRMTAVEGELAELRKKFEVLERKPPPPPPSPPPVVEILKPQNGGQVDDMNVYVEGIIHLEDLDGRFPVVAVHPLQGNLIWIQPLPKRVEKTPDGYRFRCRVYCGTASEGIGEQYELYALLPKKGMINEADRLEKLPENVPVSPSVRVTRVRPKR